MPAKMNTITANTRQRIPEAKSTFLIVSPIIVSLTCLVITAKSRFIELGERNPCLGDYNYSNVNQHPLINIEILKRFQ